MTNVQVPQECSAGSGAGVTTLGNAGYGINGQERLYVGQFPRSVPRGVGEPVYMNTITEMTGLPQKSEARRQEPGKIAAEHPFLKGLSPHVIRILSDCAMLVRFEPGELIFREGDPANRFYLIHRGKVMLESHMDNGTRIPVQVVQTGEVLGWSWLFPPHYWHFDARAIEPTEAIFFHGTPLREECEGDHEVGYVLIKRMAEILVRRLQATRRHMQELYPR